MLSVMMRRLALAACLMLSCDAALLTARTPVGGIFRPAPARRRCAPAHLAVSKQQMVDAISSKAGVSKKTAGLVLAATLDVIVESVAAGNKVSIVGFGTFDSKERPEREGRNPKTGQKMTVAAATVPTFSFGKTFKDAVKQAGLEAEEAPPSGP